MNTTCVGQGGNRWEQSNYCACMDLEDPKGTGLQMLLDCKTIATFTLHKMKPSGMAEAS